MIVFKWRRVPESNRCTRICNPLRNHSANSPNFRGLRSIEEYLFMDVLSIPNELLPRAIAFEIF